MEDKELLFEIDGFPVYDNTIYTVKDKQDFDAPSGYIERGVTRLPSDGVGDTFTCYFHPIEEGSNQGLWDTGFFLGSRCYAGLDRTSAQSKMDNAVKNVMEPYSEMIGGTEKLSHAEDNKFWLTKFMRIYTGHVFDTSNIEHRFQLYFSLMTGNLTPEGQEGNHAYSKSSYIVIDINKGMKRKDEKAFREFKAISTFMNLLDSDRGRIVSVLDFIGMPTSKDLAAETLMSMFKQLIESDESKLKLYNKYIDESSTEEGRATLELYRILKEKFPNNGITKSANGIYFYGDTEIGADLKTAAANIAKQKQFEDIKKELIFSEDEE